jgi:hypothetical protein
MDAKAPTRLAVACHVSSSALAPGVRTGLERLGYRLVWGRSAAGPGPVFLPAARIVDDRQLAKLPAEVDAGVPTIVLVTSRPATPLDDPRVVGAVWRPAALRDLYALLQTALETHPRAVPRVRAALPAKAVSGERGWAGAIVSLSERGCLLRSRQRLPSRRALDLWFALPRDGLVHVVAEPRYADGACTGLVFRETSADSRVAIVDYVAEVLSKR